MKLFRKKPDLVFTVPSMTCAHCGKRITDILQDMDGVKSAEADAGSKEIRVFGSITFEEAEQALAHTSYTPSRKE